MQDTQKIIELGQLILQFGRVERATYHEDGKRKETDTDHTVMLGVLGCSLAAHLYPKLDLGKIAQYALVHDLVEAYAGDTPSFNITNEAKANKNQKEKEALHKIEENFKGFPWLVHTIKDYEHLVDSEARFIKTLDKCMPKITHILNKGTYFREVGKDKKEMIDFFIEQHASLTETYGKEFPELLVLIRKIMDMTIKECFE